MADVASSITRETPPDVRGPTAPLPVGTFVAGGLALGLVIIGSLAVQGVYAARGGGLTSSCRSAGLTGVEGARGVCNVVEGLRSAATSSVLFLGIALGAAAIVIGFATFRKMDTKRRKEHAIAGAVLGMQAVLAGGFLVWFRAGHLVTIFAQNFLNFVVLKHQIGTFIATGAKNTFLLALGGEAGGIVLGLILSLFTLSSRRVVRAPARAYINFFRGTPLLWQLSIMYFGFPLGLGLNLSPYATALLAFALNTGAYAAEVFRAGIQSIERGQLEAARGLGMSYLQAMRYAVVPQAVRRVIPPLMNEFVILIKDTSLVIFLGLSATQFELLSVAESGYGNSGNATFFVAAAVGYLAISLPLIRLVNAAERHLRSGLVGVGA